MSTSETGRVLGAAARSAGELAAQLRRDFASAYAARYPDEQQQPDPVLETLFHALAVQLERIYNDAERVFPEAVFDDIVDGLGLPPRVALPAQVVLGFKNINQRETISTELSFLGQNKSGEAVRFLADVPVQLAPTTLAFAAVAENGTVTSIAGARVPNGGPLIGPRAVSLPGWNAAPTLFLAFECDDRHLSGLGVFVDSTSDIVNRALCRGRWQLFDETSTLSEHNQFRSLQGPGGVRLLQWPEDQSDFIEQSALGQRSYRVDEGPVGPRVFVFPPIPPGSRHRSLPPRSILAALPTLLPQGGERIVKGSLVWVQAALPVGTREVASSVRRIVPNCVSASNLEILAQRIQFARAGTAVSLEPEARRNQHIIGILGVSGDQAVPYVNENDVAAPAASGRYRHRGRVLDLSPRVGPTGIVDRAAYVRLLACDGERANGMVPGAIDRADRAMTNVTAQVTSLTETSGGSAPPPFADARLRLAELLRTRERVVTASDFDACSKAFDGRIVDVRVDSRVEVDHQGVSRSVLHVSAAVDTEGHTSQPGIVRLRDQLERHLQAHAVIGQLVRVTVRIADKVQQ